MNEVTKRITDHLDISKNHEAGLIPQSTQGLLREIANESARPTVRPAVKALDWRIREDHFRADTPSGVYTVGDAGGGLAIVRLADGCSLRCTFDEAKNVCEWHYLSCLEDTPAAPMPRNPTPEMRDAAVRSLDNAAQTQDPKAAHRCDVWPCDECGKGF